MLENKTELAAELAERQNKLKSVLDKTALYTDRNGHDQFREMGFDWNSFHGARVAPEDVDLAFLKEKRKWSGQRFDRSGGLFEHS